MDFFEIPIIIISYNRKTCLKKCLERYEQDGYKNIIIIDNASTDKDLLDFLATLDHRVIYLGENLGHMALWKCGKLDELIEKEYYVLTDPDILPIEECPADYIEHFYEILKKNSGLTKVGFSLKIDDLPESYPNKYDIIRYESFYWENVIYQNEERMYLSPIDTTFALYRPGKIKKNDFFKAIRTGGNYIARHLGWYIDKDNLSDEEKRYFSSVQSSSTSMNKKAVRNFGGNIVFKQALKSELDLFHVLKYLSGGEYMFKYGSIFGGIKGLGYMMLKNIYLRVKTYIKPEENEFI